jgi:hypothetical protein
MQPSPELQRTDVFSQTVLITSHSFPSSSQRVDPRLLALSHNTHASKQLVQESHSARETLISKRPSLLCSLPYLIDDKGCFLLRLVRSNTWRASGFPTATLHTTTHNFGGVHGRQVYFLIAPYACEQLVRSDCFTVPTNIIVTVKGTA